MLKGMDVEKLVQKANAYLRQPHLSKDERVGIAALLSSVLHDTGRYAGYNYQASEFLPADQQTPDKVLRDDYDDTRRVYYVKSYKR